MAQDSTADDRRTVPVDRNLFVRSLLPLLIAAIVIVAALVGQTFEYPATGTLPCDLSCVGVSP